MGQCLADGCGATGLAGGQVGGFEPQGVVLVFGDVFFVGRRFMGLPHGLFGLQQVFGEPLQDLLLQQEFIHGCGGRLEQARGWSGLWRAPPAFDGSVHGTSVLSSLAKRAARTKVK